MSQKVTTWVLYDSPIKDRTDLCVLWAIADAANDLGVRAFPGEKRIGELARCDPKTARAAIRRLEEQGQLLVRRPTVAGRGHHNEYAVVMGRDPDVVRDLAWPPCQPKRSIESALGTDPAVDDPGDEPPKGGRSAPLSRPQRGKESGRKTGGKRAESGSSSPPYPEPDPEPETAALRAGRRRASARDAGRELVDGPLGELRSAVDRAAAAVPWDFDEGQARMVLAQVELCGVQALVDEARACVLAKGPPRSARAWITAWELLTPAAAAVERRQLPPPCGECDRTVGGAGWRDSPDGAVRCPCSLPAAAVTF